MRETWENIIYHKWFFVSLILAVFLTFFRFGHGIIQQDNYVGYANILPFGVSKISFFDSRLLPGLPLLIYPLSLLLHNFYLAGYAITFFSFVGCYFLLYEITGSRLSVLALIFPPTLLNLASLIDTEFPFIFLILLSYSLIKEKKFAMAFLLIGFSVWFRLAGFAVIFGFFVYFFAKRDLKKFFVNLPYFAIPVLLLMIFNTHLFGSGNPFYQLFTYHELHPGRISFGIIQLGQDLVRAFRWGWYRILFSGIFYIILFSVLYFKSLGSFKNHKLEFWVITGIYIFTLTVNLVPFLENLGRYLAPVVPFFWIIFHNRFKSENWFWVLLPLSFLVVLA